MNRNTHALVEKIAVTQSKLIESIEKVEAIKTATAEMTTRWRYEDLIVQRANQGFRGAKLGMVMGALSSAIQLLSSTVVLWYGAHLMIDGEMTVGQLIAFNTLIGMVMAPILGLVGMWQRLQDAFLSLQRLSDIYDAEPEEAEGIEKTLVHLPPLQGQINFESVSFSYGSDTGNVLSEIDLEIQPGQRIALVGRSGSGKSTLISLLQRLQRATEGRILVDGHDIAVVSGRSLRSQFGVVMQDSSIFTGTIRENIALSQPEAAIERVIAAAKLAAAHDFITSFPLGYDTVIGEIGISLSGGQRQRICIARALINDPRVILFDEATSSLDTESERAIQKNMETMLRGRTALIIAHRLSTIRTADVIVVLDEGRIVESGSHAALLEQRGLYHYFHSQQLGE
jgi:ATP-binding cassette subfamily B protein